MALARRPTPGERRIGPGHVASWNVVGPIVSEPDRDDRGVTLCNLSPGPLGSGLAHQAKDLRVDRLDASRFDGQRLAVDEVTDKAR